MSNQGWDSGLYYGNQVYLLRQDISSLAYDVSALMIDASGAIQSITAGNGIVKTGSNVAPTLSLATTISGITSLNATQLLENNIAVATITDLSNAIAGVSGTVYSAGQNININNNQINLNQDLSGMGTIDLGNDVNLSSDINGNIVLNLSQGGTMILNGDTIPLIYNGGNGINVVPNPQIPTIASIECDIPLNDVLAQGNDAGGLDITNVSTLDLSNLSIGNYAQFVDTSGSSNIYISNNGELLQYSTDNNNFNNFPLVIQGDSSLTVQQVGNTVNLSAVPEIYPLADVLQAGANPGSANGESITDLNRLNFLAGGPMSFTNISPTFNFNYDIVDYIQNTQNNLGFTWTPSENNNASFGSFFHSFNNIQNGGSNYTLYNSINPASNSGLNADNFSIWYSGPGTSRQGLEITPTQTNLNNPYRTGGGKLLDTSNNFPVITGSGGIIVSTTPGPNALSYNLSVSGVVNLENNDGNLVITDDGTTQTINLASDISGLSNINCETITAGTGNFPQIYNDNLSNNQVFTYQVRFSDINPDYGTLYRLQSYNGVLTWQQNEDPPEPIALSLTSSDGSVDISANGNLINISVPAGINQLSNTDGNINFLYPTGPNATINLDPDLQSINSITISAPSSGLIQGQLNNDGSNQGIFLGSNAYVNITDLGSSTRNLVAQFNPNNQANNTFSLYNKGAQNTSTTMYCDANGNLTLPTVRLTNGAQSAILGSDASGYLSVNGGTIWTQPQVCNNNTFISADYTVSVNDLGKVLVYSNGGSQGAVWNINLPNIPPATAFIEGLSVVISAYPFPGPTGTLNINNSNGRLLASIQLGGAIQPMIKCTCITQLATTSIWVADGVAPSSSSSYENVLYDIADDIDVQALNDKLEEKKDVGNVVVRIKSSIADLEYELPTITDFQSNLEICIHRSSKNMKLKFAEGDVYNVMPNERYRTFYSEGWDTYN
jgi:hypothetical protein